ncbi:uncharacterized protein LAJ45_11106 [Morchella importuna]|uniref:uncharacterized protein n=1 Tax=Morchella importuna TaxID=1174673 RepID=UPI001E8E6D36|nr:uncharacterized protein LAJ45_11106 [Morchella importuna]KAH8144900.1 hypothetical protein LAJ45_11106 [Morchella importuna]
MPAYINPATLPISLPQPNAPSEVNDRGYHPLRKCALNACGGRFRLWPHQCMPDASRRQCGAACTTEINSEKCLKIFKDPREFRRHFNSVHIGKTNRTKFNCTEPDCKRVGDNGFARKDNLTQHLRNSHGVEIPKQQVRMNGRNQDGTPVVQTTRIEEVEGMDEE